MPAGLSEVALGVLPLFLGCLGGAIWWPLGFVGRGNRVMLGLLAPSLNKKVNASDSEGHSGGASRAPLPAGDEEERPS